MYSRLVPRLLFPACERLTGRRFWTEVERLRSRQWATPAELEARVVGRLRPLLGHAAAHVPHYREVFGDAGLDARAIRTVEDLARVPITTKADLRRRFPDGVSAVRYLVAPPPDRNGDEARRRAPPPGIEPTC